MKIAQEIANIKNDLYQISCEAKLKPPHKNMLDRCVQKLDDVETKILQNSLGHIE